MSSLFYMETTFGPSDKRIKTTDITRDEIFRRTAGYTFLTTKGMKKFWKN